MREKHRQLQTALGVLMTENSAGFKLPDLLLGVPEIVLQNFSVVLTEKRRLKCQ